MLFLLFTLFICIGEFRCLVLVDYRFSSNYGQVFYDYSGNSRHAVNGQSSNTPSKDVIATDRGIYFKNNDDIVQLPSNNFVTSNLVLPPTFTLAIWAMTVSDEKQNIFYRSSESFHLILSIKDSNDRHRLRLKYKLITSNQVLLNSPADAMTKGKSYIEKWHFICLSINNLEIKLYCDGAISLYSTLPAAYTESEIFTTYLGNKEDDYDSFSGYIYSFLLFDTLVNIHSFYSDTGSTCYFGTCPSSCSPAFIISNQAYCMSTETDYEKSANGNDCDCSDNSCTINEICLDTQTCLFPSMTFTASSRNCISLNASGSCSTSGYVFNGNICQAAACHMDCSPASCVNDLICEQCKSAFASPSSPSGCVCNKGYSNISILSVLNSCSACNPGCEACNSDSVCTKCVAYDAIPNGADCICKEGTYQNTPLTDTNACRPCDPSCKSCSDLSTCTSCISSSASTSGSSCVCNTGFISDGALTRLNSCVECGGDCLTCSSTRTCLTCKILNAEASLTENQICNCLNGFYKDSGSCEQCHIDCVSCSGGSTCNVCKDSNADPSSVGCVCKVKYYTTSPDLSVDGRCIPCNAECSSCNNLGQCTICVASHASPVGNTCACNPGFINSLSLSHPNACIPFNPDCDIINADSSCSSCIAQFAFPYLAGCKCTDGYYNITLLHTSAACIVCNSDCLTCSSTACSTCKDPTIQPSADGRCICKSGYYQDQASFLCVKCNPTCKTCKSANACLTCSIISANLEGSGVCSCPNHSTATPTVCTCNEGYYMSHHSNYFCEPCNPKCSSCASDSICTSCVNSNLTLYNDQCVCRENMYWDGYLCRPCSWLCSNCTDFNKCVACAFSNFEKNETGNCNKKCDSPTFAYLGECSDCGKLCKNCRSSIQCDECVENAVNVGGVCSCILGYEGTASCERVYFFGALSADKNNILTLAFDEDLDTKLLDNEILLSIKDVHFNYSTIQVSNRSYRFSIVADKIPKNTKVVLTILRNPVTSINNSLLTSSVFITVLNEYGMVPLVSAAVKAVMNSTKAVASSMVSSSIASSILSNPSCMWILMNTLDFISFLPLGSIPFSENLMKFFTSLGGISILPNPSNYILSVNNKTAPYSQAKKYGLETSYIFINAGPYIWDFLLFTFFIPILFIGSYICTGNFSKICLKLLLNYKYGFFVRFWMQAYLPMGILALVQLNSVIFI